MATNIDIELMADQILPRFIPKDKNQTTLTFQFTQVPRTTYRVNYVKKEVKGVSYWKFVDFEIVNDEV